MTNPVPRSLHVLTRCFAFAGWLTISAIVLGQQQAKNDKASTDINALHEQVRKHQLHGDELVAALTKLVAAYRNRSTRNGGILPAIVAAHEDDPAAVAKVLPAFAEIVRKDQDERDVYDILV